jgi:hypothetical protein
MTDITIYRGDARSWQGTLTQNGAMVALSAGDAVYFAVRRTYPAATVTSDADAVIAKSTVGSGITFTSGTHVIFRIDFERADTADLEPGRYLWEIKFKPNGLEAQAVGEGKFIINPDIVRAV